MRPGKLKTILLIVLLLVLAQPPRNVYADSRFPESMPWISFLLSGSDRSITLKGSASLPGYSPAGQLWMIAYGLEGRIYGLGASDVDGNFSLFASVPEDCEYVLLYAIDPNSPEHHALTFVDIADTQAEGKTNNKSDANSFLTLINTESTAETYVALASGLPPDEAAVTYKSKIDELTTIYLSNPPKLCSVEQSPAINVPRDIIIPTFGGDGELIERVRAAQRDIYNNVTSGNYFSYNFSTVGLYAIYGSLGVQWTRKILYDTLGEMWGTDGSLEIDTISIDDLATAYNIITNKNGIAPGFGNCREKGITGAYIATRFSEFKAIAFVGAEIAGHSNDHGFTIACRDNWDLSLLYQKQEPSSVIPNGLYESRCMLIDPWADRTWELTPETVEALNWNRITSVTKVEMPPGNKSLKGNFTTKGAVDSSIPVSPAEACAETCETCTPYSEMASQVCSAFTIPSYGEEKKYYLFKRSGTGYRGNWGGWSDRLTGYDYFYQYILPSEVETVKANFSKFSEATAGNCGNLPALCPCPPYPDIWQTGNIEVVGSFDTSAELDRFRCDNHHYGPSYLICNMWNVESSPYPGFWPTINSICGN